MIFKVHGRCGDKTLELYTTDEEVKACLDQARLELQYHSPYDSSGFLAVNRMVMGLDHYLVQGLNLHYEEIKSLA